MRREREAFADHAVDEGPHGVFQLVPELVVDLELPVLAEARRLVEEEQPREHAPCEEDTLRGRVTNMDGGDAKPFTPSRAATRAAGAAVVERGEVLAVMMAMLVTAAT